MKKVVTMIMVTAMVISLAGCGDKKVTTSENETETVTSQTVEEKTDDTKAEVKEEKKSDDEHEYHYIVESLGLHGVQEVYKHSEDLTDWGSYAVFYLDKCSLYIKFPTLVPTGNNHEAYQTDGSLVFTYHISESDFGKNINDVSRIFFAAIDKANEEEFGSARREMYTYWLMNAYSCEELDFTIETSEIVTLNQYECCKNTGTHTYTDSKGETHSFKYVAYSTFTTGGEPFYWMVLDKTDDQSISEEIIEQNAERMGYTICEDPTN